MERAGQTLRLVVAVLAATWSGAWAASATAQENPAAPVPGAAVVDQRLLELLNRLEQLGNEIRQLRGEVEVQNHEIEGLRRRQRDLYLDVDRRLRDLEVRGPQASPAGPSPAAAGSGTAPPAVTESAPHAGGPPAGAGSPADERRAYRQAFNLLKEGRYAEAKEAFRGFLSAHPQSSYADNAQYWLGEANYVTRNFRVALEEFRKVTEHYPGTSKVPDALLKIGYIHYELKEWNEARRVLEDLVERFPGTTAARLAANRLQRMKLEGH